MGGGHIRILKSLYNNKGHICNFKFLFRINLKQRIINKLITMQDINR